MAILWDGSFSSGDLSQWQGVESVNPAARLQVVAAPLRPAGQKALQVNIVSTDLVQNGIRNEVFDEFLVPKPLAPVGSERWYKWSTLFPAGFPVSTDWQVSTQFHQSYRADGTTVGVSPPLGFGLDKHDNFQFVVSDQNDSPTILYSKPLVRGVWYDFFLHVLWSSDPKVGFVEMAGSLVVPKTFIGTVLPGLEALANGPNYLKQGLYRAPSILPPATVFHQGMQMADSAADFWPVPAPTPVPVPVPAPTGLPAPLNWQDSLGAWWNFTIAPGRKP